MPTVDSNGASQLLGAGGHRSAARAVVAVGAEAETVVAHGDHQPILVADDRHLTVRRRRMADDVRHRLADDAVGSELDISGDRAVEAGLDDLQLGRRRSQLATEHLERANEAEFVQRRRPQIVDERSHCSYRFTEVSGQLVEHSLTRRGVVREEQAAAVELERQRRHHRADAVMQVALQSAPLLLSGSEQART